ncbi:hypothetical protein C8Q75DRAFT_744364 [Abortiporus biennis]|nr:hypothetical protein C8Q75DRAFT_744364 [Abortiporus biennis]
MTSEQLESLVSIPSTVVTHVLGDTSVDLAQGDLNLYKQPDESPQLSPTETEPAVYDKPILTITIGKAAFPLFKKTVFGTLADDSKVYLFSPELGRPGGYVKITLPSGVQEENSELSSLQEKFEGVLIKFGLLKEGIEAAVDEVERSVPEHPQSTAHTMKGTENYSQQYPPAPSSGTTHSTSETITASASHSILNAASKVTAAVGSVAATAGAWVADQMITPSASHEPANSSSLHNLNTSNESASGGIATGTGDVADTSTNPAGPIMENDHGIEAKDVASNTGGTAGEAIGVTSGANVTKGAEVPGDNGKHDEEIDVGAHKKEGSGQWQDVLVE